MALVPLIIRWGSGMDNEMLRQCSRCSRCGGKGADLQHPSWAGEDLGWMPFPVKRPALRRPSAGARAGSSRDDGGGVDP